MSEYFDGLGITERELAPGTAVMVPVGRLVAHINGNPCLIAWATVVGPTASEPSAGPDQTYWLNVYTIPGGPPLPQVYRVGEIVGVPALGLAMEGAPPVTVTFRSPS